MSTLFNEYQNVYCVVDGCDNHRSAHGYCPKHYARVVRNGSPDISRKGNRHTTPRLTEVEIAEIKQMHRNFVSAVTIGRKFNRSAQTIKNVINNTYRKD